MNRFALFVLLFPSIVISPLSAAEQQDVLYADGFITMDAGWGKSSDNFFVAERRLVMKMPKEGGRIQLYQMPFDKDADVRVNVTEVTGGTEAMGGVAVWAKDDENCYVIGLTSAGELVIKTFTDDERNLPLPATASSAVRKGLGKSNELRVVTRGKTLTVFVNGAQVVTMRGFTFAEPAKIGIYGQSLGVPHTWAFSNLSVRRAPTSDDAAATADPSLLLDEKFASLDPGWGPPDSVASVRDDRMVLELEAGNAYLQSYSGTRFKDADIEIAITDRAGSGPAAAGLVFWMVDPKNYAVVTFKGGIVSIGRVSAGARKNNAQVADPLITKGPGTDNVIRVVTQGESARISVNGKEMGTISGNPPKGGGRVGAYVEAAADAGHTWEITKLQVRKPK